MLLVFSSMEFTSKFNVYFDVQCMFFFIYIIVLMKPLWTT